MSPLRVACRASPPSGLPPPPRPYPVVVTYCTERAENPRSQRCCCPLPPQTHTNGLTAQASPRLCVRDMLPPGVRVPSALISLWLKAFLKESSSGSEFSYLPFSEGCLYFIFILEGVFSGRVFRG